MESRKIGWGVTRAVAAAMLMARFADAGAAGFGYEFTAGAGQSDNVARTEDNEQDETIASAGLRLSLDERTNRVAANLVGDFAFYDYLDDTFDSELIGSFVGNSTVTLIEDRLKWLVSDDFGQVLNDPLSPATPGNREHLNYFSTGLEGAFGAGSRNELSLGVHYSLASYEESPFDSSSIRGEAGLTRSMSGSNSLGFHLRTTVLDYDDASVSGSSYDQDEAFLRYTATGARTSVDADVGYTKIKPDASASEDDFLFRLDLSRQLSTRAIARLRAGQEFANSAYAFSSELSGGDVDLGSSPGRQTADPFTNQYTSLGLDLEGNRTALSVSASWTKQIHHELPIFDQTLTSLGATIRRDLTPALRLSLTALYGEGKFEQDNVDYTELDGDLSLQWQFSRRLFVTLAYNLSSRDSDAIGGDYDENRVWLTFGYQNGTPRSSLARPDFTPNAGEAGN